MASPPASVKKDPLPVEFYDVPDHCKAIFSTRLGTIPKRKLEVPYPYQIVHSNIKQDVEVKAHMLRGQFPGHICAVKAPTEWTDLYKYFDAYDIYLEGAEFCIQILYQIDAENQRLEPLINAEIDQYAADWVAWNENMVANIPLHYDILNFLSQEETANLLANELGLLSHALNRHRRILHTRLASEHRLRAQFQPINTIDQRLVQQPYQGVRTPHPMFAPPPMIDQHRIAPVPARPIPQTPQSYDRFMEHQRSLAGPHGRVMDMPRPDNRSRPRGYSDETARQDNRPRPRGYSNAAAHNGREVPRTNLRRWTSNPGVTPPRQPALEGPVYVFNSQRSSPFREPSGKQHIFSDLPTGRGNLHQCGRRIPSSGSPNCIHRFQRLSGSISQDAHKFQHESGPIPSSESLNGFQRFPRDRRILSSESSNSVQRPPQDIRRILPSESPVVSRTIGQRFPQDTRRIPSSESFIGNRSFGQDNYGRQRYQSHVKSTKSFEYQGKVPFANHPQASFSQNGACTFSYTRDHRPTWDHDGSRTVYVYGVPQSLFESHTLKEMMAECGEVTSITFLPRIDGIGQAFILFSEQESASRAIDKFDEHTLSDGQKLAVNAPIKNRERSNSHASQRSYQHNHRQAFIADLDSHASSRRTSIGKQSISYVPHLYSTQQSRVQSPDRPPLTVGFESQLVAVTAELEQHQAALNRMVKGPLDDVSNKKKKSNIESGSKKGRVGSILCVDSNKKENSPIKNKGQTPPASPKEPIHSGNQAPKHGGMNKKKGSKKTNSTRPTPSTTPTKSRSVVNLQATTSSNNVLDKAGQLRKVTEELHTEDTKSIHIRKAHSGNRKRFSKSAETECPSQLETLPKSTEPECPFQPEILSPTDTESTSISSSNISSRKTSLANLSFTSVSDVAIPRAKKSEKDPSLSPNNMPPVSLLTEPVQNVDIYSDNDTSNMTTPKPSIEHVQGKRCENLSSNRLQELDNDAAASVTELSGKVQCKEGKLHTKKISATSATSNGSQRKTDLKSAKPAKKVPLTATLEPDVDAVAGVPAEATSETTETTAEPGFPDAKNEDQDQSVPKINLDDREQFPSLGPPKSPPSAIVDGKRPAAPTIPFRPPPPIMGPLNQQGQTPGSHKNQTKPIVAIPRVLKSGPKPIDPTEDIEDSYQDENTWSGAVKHRSRIDENSLGGQLWPFVQKFRGK